MTTAAAKNSAVAGKPAHLFGGGFRNLVGAGPGHAFAYEEPTMPRWFRAGVTYTTTHEAISDFLPAPLTPIFDLPPTVTVFYGINQENRGIDGGYWPYQLFYFGVPAEYEGTRGYHGFEYVDAVGDDLTVSGDMLVAWGIYHAMNKKLARIRTHVQGNAITITVDRQGSRIAELSMDLGAEFPVPTESIMSSGLSQSISIREIPSIDWTGYAERLVFTRSSEHVKRTKAWTASNAQLHLGSLPKDPLDQLEVVDLGEPFAGQWTVGPENFRATTVIADLLAD
ncbi:MAG: hypothetical protein EOO27_06105 [Comamonadaceae bacterium]|nr:MAG: hypothetical protein EOO27_06105 [Comamonadaceae bacterium]